MSFLASKGCFWTLTASITSEVKNDHVHVTVQRILNKFIDVNFSVECMVWPWYCLFQDWTTMSPINKIKGGSIIFGQNLANLATVERFSVRNSFFFVRCFFFQLVLILLLLLLFGYSRLTALASWVDWFSSHVQTKKTLISRCSELKEVRFFVESKTFFCQTRKKHEIVITECIFTWIQHWFLHTKSHR